MNAPERGGRDALHHMESHLNEFKNSKGETWENLRLMAKMVKKASGTSMDEDFVTESFAKVRSIRYSIKAYYNLTF